MKVCILDADKERSSAIKFICIKVFEAFETECEFKTAENFDEIKELLYEKSIIFYNEKNNVICSDEFVNYMITHNNKAFVFAMADTRKMLYRLLPASPYALIDTDSFEEQIIAKLKEVIQIIVKNV